MSEALAGLASLTINGTNVDVVGDLRCDPSNLKREVLVGQSGIQGHKVMPKAGSIAARVRDNPSLTVRDFQDMISVTVVAVTASGKTYSGTNLVQTGELAVDTMEAVFDVKFEGEVQEM